MELFRKNEIKFVLVLLKQKLFYDWKMVQVGRWKMDWKKVKDLTPRAELAKTLKRGAEVN